MAERSGSMVLYGHKFMCIVNATLSSKHQVPALYYGMQKILVPQGVHVVSTVVQYLLYLAPVRKPCSDSPLGRLPHLGTKDDIIIMYITASSQACADPLIERCGCRHAQRQYLLTELHVLKQTCTLELQNMENHRLSLSPHLTFTLYKFPHQTAFSFSSSHDSQALRTLPDSWTSAAD